MELHQGRRPGEEEGKSEKTAADGYNESMCAACIRKMTH